MLNEPDFKGSQELNAFQPSGATLISTYTEAARAEACKEEALTPPSFPDVKMKKTVVGRRLSARVGDLILSRNAKVEANGVLRPTGKYEGCAPVTRSFGHTDEATPSQTMPSIVIQGEGGEEETLAPVKSPSADGSSGEFDIFSPPTSEAMTDSNISTNFIQLTGLDKAPVRRVKEVKTSLWLRSPRRRMSQRAGAYIKSHGR